MIILYLILAVSFAILIYYFVTVKKGNSCTGIMCENQCCKEGQQCKNGKCCFGCQGLRCDQTSECGEQCKDQICAPNQKCVGKGENSSCCTPLCSEPCSTDGCGGICPCEDPNAVCHEGECCISGDCSVCGVEKCGKVCTCNDDYCDGSCCQNGKCTYDNICEMKNKDFLNFIQGWAQFCKDDSCQGCSLQDAKFLEVGENKSAIPISGTITCKQCIMDNKVANTKVNPISINKDIASYVNKNGQIVEGGGALCKGNCSACYCLTDADCQRWGCSECTGGYCK